MVLVLDVQASAEAKDLLSRMLTPDSARRITMDQVRFSWSVCSALPSCVAVHVFGSCTLRQA